MRALKNSEIDKAPPGYDYYHIEDGEVFYSHFSWAWCRAIKPRLTLVRPLSPVNRDKLPDSI